MSIFFHCSKPKDTSEEEIKCHSQCNQKRYKLKLTLIFPQKQIGQQAWGILSVIIKVKVKANNIYNNIIYKSRFRK